MTVSVRIQTKVRKVALVAMSVTPINEVVMENTTGGGGEALLRKL